MGQALVENISMKNKSVKLSTEEKWLSLDDASSRYLGTIQKNKMVFYKKNEDGKVGFITHDLDRLKRYQQMMLEQKKLAQTEKKGSLLLPAPKEQKVEKKESAIEKVVESTLNKEILNHLDTLSIRLAKIEKKLGVSA